MAHYNSNQLSLDKMVSRLVFLVLTLLPSTVYGTFATLYQFNGGVQDATKFCDANQWALVETAVNTVAKGRRRLAEPRRRLGNPCTGCGPYCVKSGTGCVIHGRRVLAEGADSTDRMENEVVAPESTTDVTVAHRELGACDVEIGRVTTALDALVPTLVDSCRALIAPALRNFTCVQTTEDCFVQSFNLWDARLNTITIMDFKSGGSFCGSRRNRLLPVSFQAKSNFYIGKMQFVVRGVGNNYFSNRTEYSAPYFLNGNYDNGAPGGVFFYAGDYVLTATSEDDARQAKSISFRVNNC
jgi:hypothetical protein